MAVLPAEIPTGLVTGQFYFVSEDAADADTNPELEVVSGFVQFTASAKVLRMPSKRATIIPLTFNAKFNAEGHLVSASDPAIGIRLPATDSDLINPRDFTWRVDFFLKRAVDETTIAIDPFSFSVPVDGEVDLTEVMPVTEANGVPITQGLKGDKGDEGGKGDTGLTPNITIGTVVTTENPSDDNWVSQVILNGPKTTAAIRGTFPTTMKGDKGDTGFGVPVIAYSGDDANKYTTPGTVYQTSGSTLALNWPIAGKGHLLVIGAPGTVQQIFYPLIPVVANAAKVSYTRVQLTATTWSPWSVFTSQRVDNTAGRAIYTWDDTANREQLIYGDTGWRNISSETALFINEFTCTSAQLRRVGNYVTLNFDGFKSPSASGNIGFAQLPTGFRHDLATGSGNQRFGVATELSGSNPHIISPESTGGATLNGILRFLTYVAGRALHGSVSYYTRDPWPTALPGTAIGTIPNL